MKNFDTKDELTAEFTVRLMRLLNWYTYEMRSRLTKEGLAKSKAAKQQSLGGNGDES